MVLNKHYQQAEGKIRNVKIQPSFLLALTNNTFGSCEFIRGDKSHQDESVKMDAITVSYHTAKGSRITSVHAHDDNT
jgi:hypothetical protein